MGQPDPTIDAIWATMQASGIRPDKVWAGLKEVLAQKLPGLVARYNLENERTGANALPVPKEFYTAGEDLQEDKLPAILAGSETEFSPLGPSLQLGQNSAVVWVVHKAKMSRAEARDASLLASFCHHILLEYQMGYRNRLGQHLWRALTPGGVRAIPKNNEGLFGGFMVTLEVVQGPTPGSTPLYSDGVA